MYDSAYERRIRRAISQELKVSPGLRGSKDKRASGRRLLEHPAIVLPIAMLFVSVWVALRYEKHEPLPLILLPLSLYSLYFVISRTLTLHAKFRSSLERYLFQFLPFSDAEYFQWAIQPFLVRSLLLWLVSATVFATLGRTFTAGALLRTFGFATVHWLVALFFIFLLARTVSRIPAWLPLILRVGFVLSLWVLPPQLAFLGMLQLVTPFGWIDYFASSYGRIPQAWLLLTAFVVVAAIAAATSFRAFRKVFLPAESASADPAIFTVEAASDRLLGQLNDGEEQPIGDESEIESAVHEPAGGESDFRPPKATEIQQLRSHYFGAKVGNYVRAGYALNSWDWSLAPGFERFAVLSLSARERDVLEFLLGGEMPNWGAQWRTSVVAAAAGAACAILPPETSFILLFIGLGISALVGVPLAAGNWTALMPYRITSQLSPIYSCFPLDYREASWIIMKVNLFRIAAWGPFGVLVSALLGSSLAGNPLHGAWMGFNAILCVAASQPATIAAQFSMQTNDTQGFRLSTVLLIVLVPTAAIATGASVIILISFPSMVALWAPAAVGIISGLGWLGYGRYYSRGKFDLMRNPKS